MTYQRLNAYHVMWLFVMFDLPTTTKEERKRAARFRKQLEEDGFTMFQYSVYTRHCGSTEAVAVHMRRVRHAVPDDGRVSILTVTDKQYGDIVNIWGKIEAKKRPVQLTFDFF